MILKHSLPIKQSCLSPLFPVYNLLRIGAPWLESTSTLKLLLCSVVCIANAFDAGLAVVIAAAERSNLALSAALAGVSTGGSAEVLDVLRVGATFDVFYAGDASEWVVFVCELALLDASFETAVVDVGGCPEFKV